MTIFLVKDFNGLDMPDQKTEDLCKSQASGNICFVCFKRFQERNLQICREWISNFPFHLLARCSLAVQTSQVGSKISQQVTATRINRQKVTECNLYDQET